MQTLSKNHWMLLTGVPVLSHDYPPEFPENESLYPAKLMGMGAFGDITLLRIEHPNRIAYHRTETISPLLYELNDLTTQHAEALYETLQEAKQLFPDLPLLLQSFKLDGQEFGLYLGYPPVWLKLLELGYDIFGWIRAGLAINRRTFEQAQTTPAHAATYH